VTEDVFDLDKVIAEREERPPFQFKFGGQRFTLPGAGIDVRVIAALQGERIDDALEMLLGVGQWATLQRLEAVFDQESFYALLQAYGKHLGEDIVGESPASGSSSNGTGKKSRPTSNGSTKSPSPSSAPAS
jgi:hypothetical protein